MDKYQVLFLLIVYYIVITITTAVFSTGSFEAMSEQGIGNAEGMDAWGIMNIIFGGLIVNIPLLPGILRVFIAAPFWILLGYFVYLNIPMPLLNRAG